MNYELLGLDPNNFEDLTEREIKQAYRRAALKYHPDKNGGGQDAVEKFTKIFSAYETLVDPGTRAAYDASIRASVSKKRRFAEMDERRRNMREQLEAREQEAADRAQASRDARVKASQAEQNRSRLQAEIERLRHDFAKEERDRRRKVVAPSEMRLHGDPPPQAKSTTVKYAELTELSGFEEYEAATVIRLSDR
uniref:J domain-containing protein n=1 Tax=Compsopogon caeruleus TaxID=31354 RepID=A0A7S1TD00_9RHOD|mmetsp:Transcript_17557/g.36455  ORF Transcript_17557/g.36455 Transcript_17557/m.36455 type:complete len:194 (+) Transcript_17557:97-678(+)